MSSKNKKLIRQIKDGSYQSPEPNPCHTLTIQERWLIDCDIMSGAWKRRTKQSNGRGGFRRIRDS